MRSIVLNQPERVIPFVDSTNPNGEHFPLTCYSLGVEDGEGKLIGGVVFTGYDGLGIVLHSGSTTPYWITKQFLRLVFSYPFKQLGCRRLSTLVRTDNPHAQDFALHAGFVLEGCLRGAEPDGTDLLFYGMLANECRWLGDSNGKEKL